MSSYTLLENVHKAVCLPESTREDHAHCCQGSYAYYHYKCDGVDDRGWGCGYRTLQTICSWLVNLGCQSVKSDIKTGVPNISQIQAALVAMDDKPKDFYGSRQWIGSFEVSLVLDYFYDVPCKIIHLMKGHVIEDYLEELAEHFRKVGSPIMMGGETDNSSKGIMGVCLERKALLVVDPHYSDEVKDQDELKRQNFVKWLPISELHDSFYNLCLPKPSLVKR